MITCYLEKGKPNPSPFVIILLQIRLHASQEIVAENLQLGVEAAHKSSLGICHYRMLSPLDIHYDFKK